MKDGLAKDLLQAPNLTLKTYLRLGEYDIVFEKVPYWIEHFGVSADDFRVHDDSLVTWAIRENNQLLLEMVLSLGCTANGPAAFELMPPLVVAAMLGRTSMCDLLLDWGAQVDPSAMECPAGGGVTSSLVLTPLVMACRSGYDDVATVLLNAGAQVDRSASFVRFITDPGPHEQLTPLMFACKQGFDRCVSVLLEAGADMQIQNDQGLTAAGIASGQGRNLCLDLLAVHASRLCARQALAEITNRGKAAFP